jgi:hypothetical protein
MNIIAGPAFLVVELILLALIVLTMMRLGFAHLESRFGLAREGLTLGKKAPSWMLPDTTGMLRSTPAYDRWQFLIFTDHSLISFPDLLHGMHHLSQASKDVEILVLARGGKEHCETIIRELKLHIPVIPVDQAFYDRYHVRVMPFTTLLDPNGIIRWVGLVNTEDQLFLGWQMAKARATYEERVSMKETR